jgi:enamine deaminase RidA (YjgF/YER057c/UK114 family)
MTALDRRRMIAAATTAAAAAIADAALTASASPASDKAMGITRLASTNNFNSLAVRHGNVVYTGGIQATDFKQDFVGQTKQAFARIDGTLAAFGTSKENLLSVTIRTRSIANKPTFNKAWVEWLAGAGLPARVYAVVADLDDGSQVEIQVTAACPPA